MQGASSVGTGKADELAQVVPVRRAAARAHHDPAPPPLPPAGAGVEPLEPDVLGSGCCGSGGSFSGPVLSLGCGVPAQ